MPGPIRPEREDPQLGRVMLCRSCEAKGDEDPWHPVDNEFWFIDPRTGRPSGHCRACFSERIVNDQGLRRFQPIPA